MIRTGLPDEPIGGCATVALERSGSLLVATVTGELDAASAPLIGTQVTNSLLTTDREVRLDVGGVGFCDSSGTKAMFRLERSLADRGTRLIVCNPSSAVRRVIGLVDPGKSLCVESDSVDLLDERPATAVD